MRLSFAAVAFVAALFSSSPAQSGCPPRSDAQVARALLQATGSFRPMPPPAPISAITVAAFYDLCARNPRALICAGGRGRTLTWAEVNAVDTVFRQTFTYQDDYLRTGRGDVWDEAVSCGDCEDYALSLAATLNRAGAAGATMRLMLWSPYAGAGHATLLVQTADAGEVEIGVGASETIRPYDGTRGRRFASIRFDGRRYVAVEAGVRRSGLDVELDEPASSQ